MKPSKKTNVPKIPKYIEINKYIFCDDVQKGEVLLQYISTNENISRYFGKTSIQDERVFILKKQVGARGDYFLIKKGIDEYHVGREHLCVIDFVDSYFSVQKVV
jgi:hypothetical protein